MPGYDSTVRVPFNKGGRVGLTHGSPHSFKKFGSRKAQSEIEKNKIERAKKRTLVSEGGRIGLKAGGDGKWIQKVNASIKRRGTKGKCTPITKKGCTGKAKALAKTFKKMAADRKKAA